MPLKSNFILLILKCKNVITIASGTFGDVANLQKYFWSGCNPKKADPITVQKEELLWSTGVLGDSTPQTLVNTMVWVVLRIKSGSEHRQLRMDIIQLVEKQGDHTLVYTECVSKNHQGGLKHRKLKSYITRILRSLIDVSFDYTINTWSTVQRYKVILLFILHQFHNLKATYGLR